MLLALVAVLVLQSFLLAVLLYDIVQAHVDTARSIRLVHGTGLAGKAWTGSQPNPRRAGVGVEHTANCLINNKKRAWFL